MFVDLGFGMWDSIWDLPITAIHISHCQLYYKL